MPVESHFTEADRALMIKLSVQVERAISDIAELKTKFEKREEEFATKEQCKCYVTKDEFSPVKKVVYGLVSIILTSVVGGLLVLVIK